MNNYIALDLETTGLNPKNDKIIEIGAVRVENGMVCDTYETLVKPGIMLPQQITQITGITDEMLLDAMEPKIAIQGLLAFMKDGYPLLGHNILFDFSFLKTCAVNNGMAFQREGICTLRIARTYYPGLESKGLSSLCGHFSLEHVPHRAIQDALAAHELYGVFQKDCMESQKDENVLLPRPLIYQVKRQGPATVSQKERLKDMIERHGLRVPYQVEALTKNEASRYIDKIILEYGKGN